jgi:hypothetical protein
MCWKQPPRACNRVPSWPPSGVPVARVAGLPQAFSGDAVRTWSPVGEVVPRMPRCEVERETGGYPETPAARRRHVGRALGTRLSEGAAARHCRHPLLAVTHPLVGRRPSSCSRRSCARARTAISSSWSRFSARVVGRFGRGPSGGELPAVRVRYSPAVSNERILAPRCGLRNSRVSSSHGCSFVLMSLSASPTRLSSARTSGRFRWRLVRDKRRVNYLEAE